MNSKEYQDYLLASSNSNSLENALLEGQRTVRSAEDGVTQAPLTQEAEARANEAAQQGIWSSLSVTRLTSAIFNRDKAYELWKDVWDAVADNFINGLEVLIAINGARINFGSDIIGDSGRKVSQAFSPRSTWRPVEPKTDPAAEGLARIDGEQRSLDAKKKASEENKRAAVANAEHAVDRQNEEKMSLEQRSTAAEARLAKAKQDAGIPT